MNMPKFEFNDNIEIQIAHESQNLSAAIMIGSLAVAIATLFIYETSPIVGAVTAGFSVGGLIGGTAEHLRARANEKVHTDMMLLNQGINPFKRR